MFEEDAGLLADFVVEANEGLAEIESDLLAIEERGADIDVDRVNKVFRAIHSIKGAAGFLALEAIGALSHSMENVLSLVRSRSLVPTPYNVDCLLKSADLLRRMIENIETSNETDVSQFVTVLVAIAAGETEAVSTVPVEAELVGVASTGNEAEATNGHYPQFETSFEAIEQTQATGQNLNVVQFDLLADREGFNPVGLIQRLRDTGAILESRIDIGDESSTGELASMPFSVLHASPLDARTTASFFQIPEDRVITADARHFSVPSPINNGVFDACNAGPTAPVVTEVPVKAAAANPQPATPAVAVPEKSTPPAIERTVPTVAEHGEEAHDDKRVNAAEANIRVAVTVLDRLMNLAGELVLSRNQLLQTLESGDARGMDSVANRIDQVTTELQETIMQTRMQPIGNVFGKFTRVVRDLSKTLGKQCQLEIEGKDVELDKTIIESIGDPLTHLVRNAMDHGLETPDVRQKNGKHPVGTVKLAASHQEGKVLLTISDDGAGIDAARIRRKAVEKGLITAEAAATMSERDSIQLIFAPGFSTAEQVTAVSGRGVGMDVVKTNFERLGGSVEIDTVVGQGTTITVRLPLTLAIIPSLITSCAGQRFAIPQANISELVRVGKNERTEKISVVNQSAVLRLRGTLLPLVDLRNLTVKAGTITQLADQSRNQVTNIVVVEAGRLRYGLIVDRLHDSEEIVVKPLGRHLKGIHFLAGATVLGDGQIAMILDAAGVASRVKLSQTEQAVSDGHREGHAGEVETIPTLIFTNHPQEMFGIPMTVVARIERIQTNDIQTVADQLVLPYRGGILSLITLESAINARPRQEQTRLYVVVFRHGGREIGLIAPEIQDIRSIPATMDAVTFHEKGVLGSIVVDKQTIRILDVFDFGNTRHAIGQAAQQSSPVTAYPAATTADSRDKTRKSILLAEDSSFFRSKVKKFLEQEGWEVIACEDGQDAWEKLQSPSTCVDLLLTDIEMPRMDGFELCNKVRHDRRWGSLPVVAVTSLAGEEDRAHGLKVGVNEYMVKLDREQLLAAVARHLGVTFAAE